MDPIGASIFADVVVTEAFYFGAFTGCEVKFLVTN